MDAEDPIRLAKARRAAATRNPRKAAQHLKSAEILEEQAGKQRIAAARRTYREPPAGSPDFGRSEIATRQAAQRTRHTEIEAYKAKALGIDHARIS